MQRLLAPVEVLPPPADNRPASSAVEAGVLIAIVGIALAMRWPDLDTWYWGDEIQTVVIADRSLVDIPAGLARDGAPPLFYFLLHGWMRLFGTGETATHALTTALGLLTVVAGWWFARRHGGRMAGLLAAAAIAVNPYLVLYSTETRNYALFALLGVVSAGLALDVLRQEQRWSWVALGVALGLTMLTHAWGIFFAASVLGVLLLVALVRRERQLLVETLQSAGVAAVVFLPWVPTFIGQTRHTGAPWNTRYSIASTLDQLVAYLGDRPVAAVVVVAVLVGVGAAVAAGKFPTDVGLIAGACGLTLGLAFVASYIEPIWQARYGLVVLGALLVLAAIVAGITRAGSVALLLAIAAMGIYTVSDVVDRPIDAKPDATLRRVAAQIAPQASTFVAADQGTLNGLRFHLGEAGGAVSYVSPLGVLDDPTIYDWRDDLDHLRVANPDSVAAAVIDSAAAGDTFVLVRRAVSIPRGDAGTEWQVRYVETTDRLLDALQRDDRLEVTGERETDGWAVTTLQRQ